MVLPSLKARLPRLRHVWVDMAYHGEVIEGIQAQMGWTIEVVKRPSKWGRYPSDVEPPPLPAFTVLPRRWAMERTMAWLGRSRRRSKDDEYHPRSREAMIYLAMSRLMLRRLAHQAPYSLPSPQGQSLRGHARAF